LSPIVANTVGSTLAQTFIIARLDDDWSRCTFPPGFFPIRHPSHRSRATARVGPRVDATGRFITNACDIVVHPGAVRRAPDVDVGV
jgi:hypothetical protein